jgi:Domain of unknown function (DUF4365)
VSPQRPRSAQLEALSRQALKRWVPDHWIVRDQHEEDIGVDAEIEVITDEQPHESTGTLFKVQLKATDEPNLSRALAVELEVDRFEYFTNRLNLPTLIARYHAPSDRLYARWAHRFDVSPRREQKVLTLRLTPEDLVDESSPAAWLQDMVVTVDPRRIEIQPVPWAGPNWKAEYGVTFRNTSARVVYDVHFDVTLERDHLSAWTGSSWNLTFPSTRRSGYRRSQWMVCTRRAANRSGSIRSQGWNHERTIASGSHISLHRES